MNQDGSDEKNVNECDWNEADGMKEELIPKTRWCILKLVISDFLKTKDECDRDMVTPDKERLLREAELRWTYTHSSCICVENTTHGINTVGRGREPLNPLTADTSVTIDMYIHNGAQQEQ